MLRLSADPGPALGEVDTGRLTGAVEELAADRYTGRRAGTPGQPAAGVSLGIPGHQIPAETPDRVDPATLTAAARLGVTTVHHPNALGEKGFVS